MVVQLVWSNNLKSYAGNSGASGRVSLARQFKSEDLVLGLDNELTPQSHTKQVCGENNTTEFTTGWEDLNILWIRNRQQWPETVRNGGRLYW